jgi:hypothetical protein
MKTDGNLRHLALAQSQRSPSMRHSFASMPRLCEMVLMRGKRRSCRYVGPGWRKRQIPVLAIESWEAMLHSVFSQIAAVIGFALPAGTSSTPMPHI